MHVGTATAICVTLLASFGSVQALLAPSEKGFLAPRALVTLAEQANPANPLASGLIGAGPFHRVWIRRDRQEQLFELLAQGAVVRRHDYGAFSVVVVDDRMLGGTQGLLRRGLNVRDDMNLVMFNGLLLDGRRLGATLAGLDPLERFGGPTELTLDPRSGLYVIQFDGPVKDEWIERLTDLGTTFMQFVPMNSYVVRLSAEHVAGLEALAAAEDYIQFVGNYEPAYRIHPNLRRVLRAGQGEAQKVVVQLVNEGRVRDSIAEIGSLADEIRSAHVVGPYINVRATIHPSAWQAIASNERVFQIEPEGELTRYAADEVQGQIVAGNVTGNSPSGPDYLAWLASQGFNSTQFGSFSVNVVDDAYSLTGHPDLPNSRVAFELNPTGQSGSQGGHGFLNSHIVGGFNNGTGSAVEDSGGYNYGLGIAPWARVGVTAIFGPGGMNASSFESQAYGLGARISTNSWGFTNSFTYTSNAQEYDFLTRDVQSSVAGNQEYLVIFAAGNDGSGSGTVGSPGVAKNILTVAAGENVRQTGTDGCAIANSGANSWQDIISFSSRGPVNSAGGDGRWKPEITAPGTHIQAGVPQSAYTGSSVCNQYWPLGQTLYGWSSGTSHSTPGVAGGAALVRQWFINQGLAEPSPALLKAVLVATAEYMTGTGAGGSLPSNSQGSGSMHLGRAFDGLATIREDQSQVLTATGQIHQVSGSVVDGGQPVRIALVWTDAPGPTTGAPYVNDLNLEVTIGGNTYLGNVFSGANSATGGSADVRNNTELVFLPAGTAGSFTVTVTAASIGGDGVPGNGDSTDQDFALLIYNGSSGPPPFAANFSGSPTSGLHPLTVAFTDHSTGGPTGWSWSFGDGATSTLQSPIHTYSVAGQYSVSLTITGSGGPDTMTRSNYISVTDPPPPGFGDGSFELQTAGAAPGGDWPVSSGTAHIVLPAGATTSDGGLPTHGTNWLEVSGDGSNASTPPSNPGGAGSPPSGGTGVSTSFNHGAGATELTFDAAFMRNETAGAQWNDWMSVDITDGSTWFNLYHADTNTPTPQTSSRNGFPMTAVSNVVADLATIFPGSSTSTVFTLTVQVGNLLDGIQSSIGYVDNFALGGAVPAPVADFTGTPLSGVAPLAVAFSDASTGSVSSWAWDFGDGGTSSAQNPAHTYTAAGTYSVSLTATGPGGSDTLMRTAYISVAEPPPVADFSGTPTSGTNPLTVSFSDASSGAVTSWAWDFGDGGTSTLQSPSHTYAAVGTYSVSLAVTSAGGTDTLLRTNYIVVSDPPPVAAFSGTPTGGTVPLSVAFADASSGPITSWAWTFGDGGTSSLQNPSYVYSAVGTYSVSLTVTGPGGSDTLTRTNYIDVTDPPPVAEFSGTPTSGTAPLTVAFSDASTGVMTSWAWDFGDGGTSSAQNPSHVYSASGTYTVALTVTGPGGSDTRTRANYIAVVDPPPVAAFTGTPTSGVTPLTVSFADASSGPVTSWAWAFGDGATSTLQSPSHVYGAVGTYSVSLTVTGPGGSDALTRTNYIVVSDPPPVAAFSGAPTNGTIPLDVVFSDASTGVIASWAWDFGDGGTSSIQNPNHTYTIAGVYSVTLTVTGPGGSDFLTRSNYIVAGVPAPVAAFDGSPVAGIAPLNVVFSDGSAGSITSWAWDFGDGGTSTVQNPSNTYSAVGVYSVSLTVTGPGGSDTMTRVNYIDVADPPPVADFTGTPTSGTVPLTVSFSDGSTGALTSWAWDFGDGATSAAQNPSHTYAAIGTYSVSLTVTGPGGSDLLARANYITVSDAPPAEITDGSFEAQTAGAAPAAPWAVDAGLSHLILPAGLTTSDGGLPTDGVNWLEVSTAGSNGATGPSNPGGAGNAPVGGSGVSTTFNIGASVTELSFDAAFMRNETANSTFNDWMSVDVTDGVTTVNVYYADTGTATPQTSSRHGFSMTAVSNVTVDLAVLFPSATPATVFTLTAQVGNGVDNIQDSIGYADNFALSGAVPAPLANFSGTPLAGTAPLNVIFSDASTGTVDSWAWDFGDGFTSTAQNPSHLYTAAGSYTVSLTVTGPGGSDSLVRAAYVDVTEPAPVADFVGTPTSGSAPLTVAFTDASTGVVSSWAWDFGDGSTAAVQNPSHVYSVVGSYAVSLTVTGPGGSDTLTRTAYIDVTEPPPVAGFSGVPTSGTSPLTVTFADSSTGLISSYAWAFGDGGTSTLQNPSHVYAAVGTYSVSLTVTGPGGSDTLTRTNYIDVTEPAPIANFSGVPTSGTSPLTVAFSDASTGAVSSYAWAFGDGATSTLQSPSHVYSVAGTYSVSLMVTGPGGSDTLTRTNYIDVTEPAPVAGFSGTPTSGASPLTVAFSDASTGGATSTLQNPSHVFAAVGTYSVALTVTGPGGSDTLTRTNYIDVTEPAPVAGFSGTPTSGTSPLTVAFSDASTGAVSSYAWTFGDGATSTLQNPSHVYAAVGTYSVALTVTGPGGADTLTRTNYIDVTEPAPVAGFSGTPTSGTSPLTVAFSDASTGAVSSYAWTFGDGGTSTLQNPSHVYGAAGTYSVALTVTGPGGADTLTRTNYIDVTEPADKRRFALDGCVQ